MEWFKLITITGSAQFTIQAIGLVCGILVIRLLPTREYALYTLAFTMLSTLNLLTDGGVGTGVISQGGKVWNNPEKLGAVLNTGIDLRKKFAMISLLIAMPVLLYLLRHHGAGWIMSILIMLAITPIYLLNISGTLFETILKLRQEIVPMQKVQIGNNVGRLLMLCLTLFIFPWAVVAIFVGSIPQVWANINYRKIVAPFVDKHQKPDRTIRKEILAIVKRLLPSAFYLCFVGQISLWLISIVGSTSSVAQIGALGRLGMVINLFSVTFSILISPRFARLPNNYKILLTRYLQAQFGMIVLSILIICVVYIFPSQILWILGKSYSNLKTELLLAIIGSCLSLLAGSSFMLYTSRGWAIHPVISISIGISSIALGVFIINVSTLRGVLKFNIFVAFVEVMMGVTYSFIKLFNVYKQNKNAGLEKHYHYNL